MNAFKRLRNFAMEIWLPLVLFAAWWVLSADSQSVYFPPLEQILTAFREAWLFAGVGSELVPSLTRFVAGLAIAIVVGVSLGVALGSAPPLRRATMPMIEFMRAIPAPAVLPAMIAVLGFGNSMKIVLIAFGCVWPILLNTIDGVRSVDPLQLDFARVYRLSRRDRMLSLVIPAASPRIFAGLRIALALGLIVMVISEILGSSNGLGFVIIQAQQTFAIPQMWAGILVLGIVGFTVNSAFLIVERRALRWYHGWRGSQVADAPG
ncbi:MAG TPA: ABC transporter permease [Solirubrobacterales bacterium]|nr:ABC transporter permease [Solirubrobacterales bacterium]